MALDDTDPFELFDRWFAEAGAGEPDANAMTLATADAAGRPSARMVLLKGWDRAGFVFYTNLESRKGRALAENPRAALLFHWKSIKRQVRIEGAVGPVADFEADAYFATRARDSQIGAWASRQSRPMATRFDLEKAVAKFAATHIVGRIERPPFWSGYRVAPEAFEFWTDRPFRLHERLSFTRAGDAYELARLFP
jgi:pyridoxamine 5'-phosphate oxidase